MPHSLPLMAHFSPLYVVSNQLERVKEIAQQACAAADKAVEEVTELKWQIRIHNYLDQATSVSFTSESPARLA
jgi:hypothetical protein